jgi:hypothetical protein
MTFRGTWALAALASGLTLSVTSPALAADNAGSTDLSSINANGSPEPIRTGFFAETALGGFLTIGGQNYSNTAAFLSLGAGYDILDNLSAGIQFQLAPSVQDCYNLQSGAAGGAAAYNCGGTTGTGFSGASTFTLSSIDAKVSYRIPVADRIFIPIRAFGGVTNLAPSPQQGVSWVGSVGGATGIEWATPFDHFNLGAEVAVRFVLQINAIALSFYPTVKYTF